MRRQPQKASLDDAFVTPEAKHRYTRRLFATIADRYDVITRLLSFGQDQRWKRQLIDLAGISASTSVLDLACGTGDLAFLAADRGATVTALDFTPRMIALGRAKVRQRATPDAASHSPGAVTWVVGDMGDLPIADSSVDVVTTGYGLRNVPDLGRALSEIYRVLRPGHGVLCSLDFNRPERTAIRAVYLGYLTVVGSTLGWALHRDPDTYRYIPASIRRYPGARGVAALMRAGGFQKIHHVPVLGGFMAIHVARK
ncbi:MAG: ubiquinone/menaquinone biosynthesis methyltransferase [Acidobacteriota bacterium]